MSKLTSGFHINLMKLVQHESISLVLITFLYLKKKMTALDVKCLFPALPAPLGEAGSLMLVSSVVPSTGLPQVDEPQVSVNSTHKTKAVCPQ